MIKAFQAGGVYKPKPRQKKIEKKSATFIEVGMKKQFHFRDGSVRVGEVISVSDDIATLKTSSGSFRIPKNEFLDETAEIKNKRGSFLMVLFLEKQKRSLFSGLSMGTRLFKKETSLA